MGSQFEAFEVQSSGHVFWNVDMDNVMLETLKDQLLAGNKSQGGWKSAAYTAVANNVQTQCQMKITSTHVKSRMKTWKKMISGIQELLGMSGFGWDDVRKTVTAEESVWADALKVRKNLRYLKGKSIEKYTELVEVIGEDQANGAWETTAAMVDEEMSAAAAEEQEEPVDTDMNVDENPQGGGDEGADGADGAAQVVSSSSQKKRSRSMVAGLRDEMSGMRLEIGRIAGAMESKNMMEDPLWNQFRDALSGIAELDDDSKMESMEWFVGDVEKRRMFLSLDESQRRRWIVKKFGFPSYY